MTTISQWILKPSKWGERILGAFKYLVAVYMMVAGVITPFIAAVDTRHFGWVYSSKWSLICLGLIIFLSGLWLFLGKIRKRRKQTGQGLMAVFCCFLFAGMLNSVAFGALDSGNFIAALVMGLLYLRWRFKTAYINPDHFLDDAQGLRTFEHH